MKTLLLSLFVSTALYGSDFTNGVFYADKSVECRLISQSGATTTNQLSVGKTYMVGNALLEIDIPEKTTFYLSGGPMIEAGFKSTLTINLFDQEVKNLSAAPRKAEFGNHNIGLTFSRGEFSVVYPNKDSNNSLTVSTPFSSYQLNGGKYFFRVSEKSVVAYVLEGMLQLHGEKNRVDITDKGKLAVAIPFTDPSSGIEDKIISSIKPLKPEEIERFSSPVLMAEKKWADVQFYIVGNQVIGIWMK